MNQYRGEGSLAVFKAVEEGLRSCIRSVEGQDKSVNEGRKFV